MKKIICFMALLSAMFLLTSCGSSGNGNDTYNYRVGSEGLELQFGTSAPPYTVFAEDGKFAVSLEVRNKGVYPSEDDSAMSATVYFLGFDQQIVSGLTTQTITFEPGEAKTRYNPEGDLEIINLEPTVDSNYFTDAKIGVYDASINAVICYPYKTSAAIDVCVDPDPNSDDSLDVCEPGQSSAGSQGAPVAISSVQSVAQKGKARFVIEVANVGGGDILRESSLSSCTDANIDRGELDKIEITHAELSNGITLDCAPDTEIKLINGRATIICKAEGLDETQPAYKTILQMELSYGYKKSVQRSVRILGE
jgi:hypothetical protein